MVVDGNYTIHSNGNIFKEENRFIQIMFNNKKIYYSCKKDSNDCYKCQKFNNFHDADINATLSILLNSNNNINFQNIEVCEKLPEFLVPMYLRYKLIKSNFDFKISFEE